MIVARGAVILVRAYANRQSSAKGERLKRLIGLLVLVLLFLVSCGGERGPVNVLLIGVDTLRPDHLGCYGYHRDTSPNIDRLAETGVLFEHVVSQCPWTLPSFATIMTSLYPAQHGAGIDMARMGEDFPTLAGILAERGYKTGAVVNVSVLAPDFGVDRGFEHYDSTEPGEKRIAGEVTREALAWIRENRDKPFFMFVHYFDPHFSYSPPAPYDTLFNPDYRGRVGRRFDDEVYDRIRESLFDETDSRMKADWRHIEALYDGEIAYTDRAVGELLTGLSEMGLEEKTLVVFVSDHGEEFFEHKGYGHGHTLYGEVINVPMVISMPDVLPGGRRIKPQVRLVDVVPTVLDILGIQIQAEFEGASLMPLACGYGEVAARPAALFPPEVAFSEGLRRGGERKGVTAHPWKLIYHMPTGSEALFNLAEDPGETEDVIERYRDVKMLLTETLFKNLLAMSDTWYVEMAAGGSRRKFDIGLTAVRGGGEGRLYFQHFWDRDGHMIATDAAVSENDPGSALEVHGLTTGGTVRLAFRVELPPGIPLTFDLRIDGQPAPEHTYFGPGLKSPAHMPFSRRTSRAAAPTADGPRRRPDAPYFVIWHTEGQGASTVPVDLRDDLKADLKALGYIQ